MKSKVEVALLLLLFLPGVYQDLKYRKLSKEYCLVLVIGSFLYSLGRQIMKGVDSKLFLEHLAYIVSLLLIRKYGYLLRGSIGLADLVAILVFSLFLEVKYLLLVIVLSLLFVVVIGSILQGLKSKGLFKRFHKELPYIPLLYGSLIIVTWIFYY